MPGEVERKYGGLLEKKWTSVIRLQKKVKRFQYLFAVLKLLVNKFSKVISRLISRCKKVHLREITCTENKVCREDVNIFLANSEYV